MAAYCVVEGEYIFTIKVSSYFACLPFHFDFSSTVQARRFLACPFPCCSSHIVPHSSIAVFNFLIYFIKVSVSFLAMGRSAGTVLITGGTSGLGYEAAFSIAQQAPEYYVVLASRTNPNNAHEAINKATKHRNSARFMSLDLSSLQSVRAFVDDYARGMYPPLKALVLNAGLQLNSGLQYSRDGIEKTFAINHVGHALLVYLLRPFFAYQCRIVVVASGTHDPAQKTMVPDAVYNTAEELAHPSKEQVKKYDGRQVYATSKLCNVLWSYALQRRLAKRELLDGGSKWTVSAFDPGLMPGTGLARDAPAAQRFIWNKVLPSTLPLLRRLISPNIHTTKDSGESLAHLAVGDLGGVFADGKYFEGRKEIKSSVASYEVAKQEDLWEWTINAVAKDEAEKSAFEFVYF